MNSWYLALVGFTALQRFAELRYSARNRRRLLARGFELREPPSHYRLMVTIHTTWFVALLLEPLLFETSPSLPLAGAASAVFLSAQALRAWTLGSLGAHWNTSIMAPGPKERTADTVVASGPYRFIRHPNYAALILEFAALPLVGGAYGTALLFSLLNGLLLRRRIPLEERALFERPGYREAMGEKPRFIPLAGTAR